MKDHVVDEARDDRLDSVGLVLVRLDDLVEERQGPDLIGGDDLLRLFRGELALESRFRRFEFRPLGFERSHPFADRGHRLLAAFGHDIDQTAEFGPDAGELDLHPLKVGTEFGEGLGRGLVRLLGGGADPFGLEVELLEEFEDRVVEGLGRDVPLGASAAGRLLRGNAVVVVVVLAAPALPGLGGHFVAAAPAAEESLEEVDVLARLAAVAVVPAIVPVHEGLDLLVDLPGPDGLPEGVEELALVLLLPGVDRVPQHPAENGFHVELAGGRAVAPLAEFPDEPVDALEFEVEGLGGLDVRQEALVGSEDLPHHLHPDGRGADGEPFLDSPEDLVPHAGRGHLALILSKGHEDYGDESPGGGREVDVFAERHELHVVLLKGGDELEEVGHIPRDPLQARDHDDVDHPRLGELEKLLVGGALGVLAALPAALALLLALDEPLGQPPVLIGSALDLAELGDEVELRVDRAVFLHRLLVVRDSDVGGDVNRAFLRDGVDVL